MSISKPSLSTQILIGLFTGVACGLFFGDYCAPLDVVGDAFIGLLQMTVLPYIVLTLLVNIGRLSMDRGRRLIAAGLVILALLIAIGVTAVAIAPLALPDRETASFFSTSMVEPPPEFDLVGLYIPTNPFASLADNIVPAVVLFCIMVGLGLARLEGAERLLDDLDVMASALNRVNTMVVKMTPVGVFAIAAATAGTMTLEEVGRLQAYLILYTAMVLVLTFWVVPSLVEACTPFRAKDVLRIPKATMLTIFATGKIIVVLPQLIEDVKRLFREADLGGEEVDSTTEVLMPLAYPFPNLGTVAIMVFVPFAGWYLGSGLKGGDWLMLLGAGTLSSFVAPVVGIPFLMSLVQIPSDMFQLFVISTVYTDRIRVVLGAMHLFALTAIVTAILTGAFKIKPARLIRTGIVTVVLAVFFVVGIRLYLGQSFRDAYTADQALVQMHLMRGTAETTAYLSTLPPPLVLDPERSRLDQVRERGLLRIGFLKDSLPFAFVNSQGLAVGFDLEMADNLARDLGVALEVVRLDRNGAFKRLEDGTCDLVMSGLVLTSSKPLRASFSRPYMDQTLAFLVRDNRQRDFATHQSVQGIQDLKIGLVPELADWEHRISSYVPDAEIVRLDSPRGFLRGEHEELDALLYVAEAGSAWTLLYPAFSVAIPKPMVVQVPMAYALPSGEQQFRDYLDSWIEMRRRDGTIDRLFEHWILGRGTEMSTPRWSVIRDVLGWVE